MDIDKRAIQSIQEGLEQHRASIRKADQELQHRWGNWLDTLPQQLGRVNDIKFLPSGSPDPTTIGRAVYQYQVGTEVVYTNIHNLDQVRAIAQKVAPQRNVFSSLQPEEQTGIQEGFDSATQEQRSAHPFRDYLQSEALGRHFRELKQNPPRPFRS